MDNTAGETLSTEEREEYERYLERFHKRCKLGGKANRLVHIVDRYMPRIAEENRIFVMRFPDKVEKDVAKGPRDPQKDPGKEKAATRGKDEPLEVLRPANMGEDAGAVHSPANPWPWGPEGRPSDTGRSQGVLTEGESSSTNGGDTNCTTGASRHTAAEPTLV